jgi:hypothetical protein
VTEHGLQHAFTGEYYRRFVPSEPVGCPRGAILQTREHILRECRLHAHARHHLRKVSANLSLPIILGSQKGLEALVKFLTVLDAFKKTSLPLAPDLRKIWTDSLSARTRGL